MAPDCLRRTRVRPFGRAGPLIFRHPARGWSRPARTPPRCRGQLLRHSAETTSTGSRNLLPSPQPLSPLGRGALGQVARVVLEPFLRALDYTVEIAHDGPQGVRLAKVWRPDLILCDLGLPQGMSGFDVARSLRGEAQTHEVPIVAVTGYGRAEDQDESRRAGFDAHLTKPIGLDAIRRVLTDLGLNRAGEGAQRTPGT